MNPLQELEAAQTRRAFLEKTTLGLGSIALADLLRADETKSRTRNSIGGFADLPHHQPKVKRVIYLFQSGGPSQHDLFDNKPLLKERFGQEVPKSVYPDERKTTMTSGQASFPVAPTSIRFARHGRSGIELGETLPHLAKVVDDICVIKSMHGEAINHDPAATCFQTGSVIPGRPSIGSWVSYGLGSDNSDLPAYVALTSNGTGKTGQPLYDRLWGSGFLPGRFQGVKFRGQGDPILDLYDPSGLSRTQRRRMLDTIGKLNQTQASLYKDPTIKTRIAQYELAYRMQTSVPELTDISGETKQTFDLYGEDAKKPGTYAFNCLLARRLAERGVRFIQLYHPGWDQHGGLPGGLRTQARETDQPSAALVRDLKQRGMLDDTLVIWGGEFGRTNYCQGTLGKDNFGRDHHGRCYSLWMAGGGTKGGTVVGQTDDYGYNVVEDGVHVHDFHATLLHLLGIDHERLTFKYQGRYFRLTDVHGHVVKGALA